MPSRCARPKIGRALALGVGVDGIGLEGRAVFGHEVEDGIALPGAAGDEAGEQRDVGVRYQIVADAAVSPVADVVFGHQALWMEVPLRAVGRSRLSGAPVPRQAQAGIGVDHGGDRGVEGVLRDMALVDEGDLAPVQFLHGAGRLRRSQLAAVAEDGGDIPLAGPFDPGIEAGDRTEVAGPVQPVLGVGQGIDEIDRRQPVLQPAFQFGGPVGRGAGAQALQDGFSADDFDVFVGGEPGIDGLCRGRQPFPQPLTIAPGEAGRPACSA